MNGARRVPSRRRFLSLSTGATLAWPTPVAGAATARAAPAGSAGGGHAEAPNPYARWPNGPSPRYNPTYFPIGVWLQEPDLAPQYRAAGINLYVGLWQGPTEEQLATLARHGMR